MLQTPEPAPVEIVSFLSSQLGNRIPQTDAQMFSVCDESGVYAAAAFFNYRPGRDIEVCLAATRFPFCLLNVWRNIVTHYAWGELGLLRITAEIDEANQRSVRLALAVGFEFEGRKMVPGSSPSLILGLYNPEVPRGRALSS